MAPAPRDLRDRRCEITGPPDAKMLINALNSGARVYMADFEDASSPMWDNLVQGQVNLTDAIRRRLQHVDPRGKQYALNASCAVLVVRPRGWHLVERHLLVDGEPVSASLFDAGLYVYRNARTLLERGSGPYLYLPKLEGANEAAGFTLAYDPSISIFHPDFTPSVHDGRSMRKAYSYGLDHSRLLKHAGFSRWYAAWRFVQLIAASALFLVQGEPPEDE